MVTYHAGDIGVLKANENLPTFNSGFSTSNQILETGHIYEHGIMNHPISEKHVNSRIFCERSVVGKNLNSQFEEIRGAFTTQNDNLERGDYCTIYYAV